MSRLNTGLTRHQLSRNSSAVTSECRPGTSYMPIIYIQDYIGSDVWQEQRYNAMVWYKINGQNVATKQTA